MKTTQDSDYTRKKCWSKGFYFFFEAKINFKKVKTEYLSFALGEKKPYNYHTLCPLKHRKAN